MKKAKFQKATTMYKADKTVAFSVSINPVDHKLAADHKSPFKRQTSIDFCEKAIFVTHTH